MVHIIAYSIVVITIILSIGYFIKSYKQLVLLKENVLTSYNTIEPLLTRQANEVPALMKSVKESILYRKNIFGDLSEISARYFQSTDINEKVELSNQISHLIKHVLITVESYTDLKVNNSFLDSQNRVREVMKDIDNQSVIYNECVNANNACIHNFPNTILVKISGYREKATLQIPQFEEQFEDVQIV